jgi:DNA-binding transcriptional ArsR family regulator
MEDPLIRRFDLGAWLEKTVKSRHLVGRGIGRQCREAIEQQLRVTAGGSVTTLDCTRLEHLDFTAADECFSKLILRVQALEYGDLFVMLAGLTPTQEENLIIALERKYLATLVQRKQGPAVIGELNPYLREAFDFLVGAKVATARDWADATGGSISFVSTTLLNLYKARLVKRTNERLKDGGRQFVYRLVEGSLEKSRCP